MTVGNAHFTSKKFTQDDRSSTQDDNRGAVK